MFKLSIVLFICICYSIATAQEMASYDVYGYGKYLFSTLELPSLEGRFYVDKNSVLDAVRRRASFNIIDN